MNPLWWIVSAVFAAVSVAAPGPAAGVVMVGPGRQVLVIGRERGDLVFTATGVANTASLFSFVIEYEADDPYEPIADQSGFVDCTVEEDLEGFAALVSFFPDRVPGEIIVSFAVSIAPPSFAPPMSAGWKRIALRESRSATTAGLFR